MLWRMILERHRRAPGRAALCAAATAAGVGLAGTTAGVLLGAESRVSSALALYGETAAVLPAGGAGAAFRGEEAEAIVAAVAAVAGARAVPALIAEGSVAGRRASLVGTDVPAFLALHPAWELEGSGEPGGAVLGAALAAGAGVAPGGEIRIEVGVIPLSVPVSGVIRTGETADGQALLPAELLAEAVGRPGERSAIAVQAPGGREGLDRVRAAVAASGIPAEVRGIERALAAEGEALAVVRWGLGLLALVVALASLGVVASAAAVSVVEREGEIGLLRALGGKARHVRALVAGDVLPATALGGMAGGALGWIAARGLAARLLGGPVEAPALLVPLGILAGLALGALASVPAARRALAVRPARLLSEE
ncbi:MAG: FtsX-like permease family protein [Planctomycetales bacterium]|nr:FtsX-like permease family protein [Planctomycetales bacterium]